MIPPDKNLLKWANDLEMWYTIDANLETMREAYKIAFADRFFNGSDSYEKTFICIDGKWTDHLETIDREDLVEVVKDLQGSPDPRRGGLALPTADLRVVCPICGCSY
tara:strand:+ start:702 stop:1022 length:321 start_codon:yes stop_codon:yes gene_type:complete